jgi:hypothetical protein
MCDKSILFKFMWFILFMKLFCYIILLICLHFGTAVDCPTNMLSSNEIDCDQCDIGYVFNEQDECTKCTFPEISYKIAEKGDVCESAYDLKPTSQTQLNLVLKFPVSPNIL